MTPLEVTAHLAGGFVAMDPWSPMLDGIMAYQALRRQLGDAFYTNDPERDGIIEPDLPLERRGRGDDWYWACSGPQYEERAQYIRHWHKRFDDQHAARYLAGQRGAKINTASGRYKAWRKPQVCRLADRIVWHAVGDRQAVAELLADVTHVGKRYAHGMGAVLRWEVVGARFDRSEVAAGEVIRPLPWDENTYIHTRPAGGNLYIGEAAIRPPYWWRGNLRMCLLPGTRV